MQLGEKLIPFKLKDIHGKFRTDAEMDGKLLLLIFTCNHCPYARAYLKRIHDFSRNFKPRGVSIAAINPNDAERYPEDSFEKMPPFAEAMGLQEWYLHDEMQETAKACGAQRTPEVFLFNKERKLCYKGAIDDNWERASSVKKRYLEDAVYALLQNKEVKEPETSAVGCSIKWKPE